MPSDQMLLAEMEAAVHAFDAGQIRFRSFLDRLESCADDLSDEDLLGRRLSNDSGAGWRMNMPMHHSKGRKPFLKATWLR